MPLIGLALLVALALVPAPGSAQERVPDEEPADAPASGEPAFRAAARTDPVETRGRASSTVPRSELEERVVRSTPDALRAVPGVSIQQTAHGQASPYVRGLTGQQVLLVFDGLRLNNAIFRQGPNQYFFTVDPATLESLHVLRGSAGTRWGEGAIGGAILAVPREPRLDPSRDELVLRPRARGRFGSADLDLGGRAELDAQLGREVAFLGGVGYRAADRLQGGGIVCNLAGGPCEPSADPTMRVNVPVVPFVEADGRTMRGTGFRVLSWDGRLVWRPSPRVRITASGYGFHQMDSPRTDQCPAPGAPGNDCLVYAEQARTLASLAGTFRPDGLEELRVALGWQRVYEHRRRDRPTAFVVNEGRDTVDTFALVIRGRSAPLRLAPELSLVVHFGADGSSDAVRSSASIRFTDLDLELPERRGQYVDRAVYALLGGWVELEARIVQALVVRGGLRAQYAGARASADPSSGTRAVRADFGGVAARVAVEVSPIPELAILANVDQGLRAPNLDDLTSRQQAGPGFQIESPDLREERSTSFELGVRAAPHPALTLEAWGYAILLEGAITRVPREASACPPATPQCGASWSRYQLENAAGESWVLGAEGAVTLDVTEIGLVTRATISGAWGEGPSPIGSGRVPLSRVPPLGGIVDVRWAHAETGVSLGGTVRWAADQTRLAPADLGDARIPLGGTPGYAVVDLRAGWALDPWIRIHVVLENLLDAAYRVHGSSIQGPGRGVLVMLDAGL